MKPQCIEPQKGKYVFTCPHCKTITQQYHDNHVFKEDRQEQVSGHSCYEVYIARCTNCGGKTIWVNQDLVYPDMKYPMLSEDAPESVANLYNEAGCIYTKSPRAACALLRLSIEKLCAELNAEGDNINQQIRFLVKHGLPERIQKKLDIVRVVGNKAVHAGFIDFNIDDAQTVLQLFDIVNDIVESTITKPKRDKELFDSLPESTLKNIEKRDNSLI